MQAAGVLDHTKASKPDKAKKNKKRKSELSKGTETTAKKKRHKTPVKGLA